MDAGVGAEPGELPFCVAAGVLFHEFGGVFDGTFAAEVGGHFAVAEGTEPFDVFGVTVVEEGSDFVEKTGPEHLVDAGVDVVVELFAGIVGGDLDGIERGRGFPVQAVQPG